MEAKLIKKLNYIKIKVSYRDLNLLILKFTKDIYK